MIYIILEVAFELQRSSYFVCYHFSPLNAQDFSATVLSTMHAPSTAADEC